MYVPWHDLLDKLIGFANNKTTSVRLPRNDIFKAIIVHLLQSLMQLEWKGQGHTASLTVRLLGAQIDIVGVIVVVVLHEMTIVHLGRLGVSHLTASGYRVACRRGGGGCRIYHGGYTNKCNALVGIKNIDRRYIDRWSNRTARTMLRQVLSTQGNEPSGFSFARRELLARGVFSMPPSICAIYNITRIRIFVHYSAV